MGEFGDKFRKAREKKGISLEDVSKATKISSRNLKAIEDEHFDQLPGGVFNKGFIRAYAKHVGLDDKQAVNEYLASLRQAQIDAQALYEPKERPAAPEKRPFVAPARAADAKSGGAKRQADDQKAPVPVPVPVPVEELPHLQLPRAQDVRPPRRPYPRGREGGIPWRIIAAAVVVAVLGFILWSRHGRSAPAAGAAATPSGSLSSVAAATPAGNPVLPAAAPASNAVSAAAPKDQKPASPVLAAKPPSSAVTPAGSITKVPDSEDGDSSATKVKAPVIAAPAALNLVIRANENSWVSVSADGQVVSQETLIAPAHTSVHANREIVAKIGNAAGVSFLWNGQEIPPDGQESEVKTFVFDASGMRVLTPQPPAQTQ